MSRDQSYKDAMSKQATIRASQNSQIVEVKANTTLQSMLRDFSKSKAKRAFKELDDRMCSSAQTGPGFTKRGLVGGHSEQRVGSDSATYNKKEAEDAFNALDKAMHKRAKRISNEHAGIIQSKLREYDDRLGGAAEVTKLPAKQAWRKKVCKHDDGLDGAGLSGRF